ncbi:receptor-type tyrosine-protein phosphatase S-like [Gigantopelta aegis]|uniref:receptor-type tyrosine-protein phosphatase S-like n=1 Tax=Gigantopelta aegis TaxID=1735272 RepID=UPI001B887852|nr:receptor-type tyrosine-protein phosphatase S-like [Gigantopelta aegis]
MESKYNSRSSDTQDSSEMQSVFKTRPVKMKNFNQHITELYSNMFALFIKEWSDLDKCTVFHTAASCALEVCNRRKNRYQTILPYVHSRVTLEPLSTEGSDYINADFITGHKEREYIATQAPLKETFADFWRMVWQYKCRVIVMLAELVEHEIVKVDRYWPDRLGFTEKYGDIAVRLAFISQRERIIVRKFHLTLGTEKRVVSQYVLEDFKEDCSDVTPSAIVDFIQTVREDLNSGPDSGPAVVHCSAGLGRTGVFIALDYFQQRIAMMSLEDTIDVFAFVLKMRNHRPHMVQNLKQYLFIHDLLNLLIFVKQVILRQIQEMQADINNEHHIQDHNKVLVHVSNKKDVPTTSEGHDHASSETSVPASNKKVDSSSYDEIIRASNKKIADASNKELADASNRGHIATRKEKPVQPAVKKVSTTSRKSI